MSSKVGFDDWAQQTGATAADVDGLPHVPMWPEMAPEAYYGLAGRIVETVSPHSEADPVATLTDVLVATGNLIGPGPHAQVQFDRHPARLYAALVGATGKGRKGLAWSTPRYLLRQVEPEWAQTRIATGLSSGEGLIYHVRDPRSEQQPVKEKGRVAGYQTVQVDSGVSDKRLLVIEPELAIPFKRMNGDTNSLSGVLRDAWDDVPLGTLTKNSPLRATGAHVSLVGHVTAEELRLHLTEVERANGFANRFLFFLVRRSKCLPEGAAVPGHALAPLVRALEAVVQTQATTDRVLDRTPEAAELWAGIYPELSAGEPGLVGAMLGRAEAQVVRLSVAYALLDQASAVAVPHLKAALAVWDHCESSVRRIFGGRLGIPLLDTILGALRQRGPLTTSQVHGLFGRHRSAEQIRVALDTLLAAGKVRATSRVTEGRSAMVWEAMP
jgi:hypothetical protein